MANFFKYCISIDTGLMRYSDLIPWLENHIGKEISRDIDKNNKVALKKYPGILDYRLAAYGKGWFIWWFKWENQVTIKEFLAAKDYIVFDNEYDLTLALLDFNFKTNSFSCK